MYKHRDRFIETLIGLRRSKSTIAAYDNDLKSFYKSYDVLTLSNIQEFVIKSKNSEATIRRNISSFKTYSKYMSIDINFSLVSLQRLPIRERSYITDSCFNKGILNILEDKKASYSLKQITTMFNILYKTGMRVNELLTIDKNNYNKETCTVTIIGKGNKERRIPVHSTIRKFFESSLFYETLKQIHYNTILYWTKKYFGEEFSPHSFRHGFITKIIDSGAKHKVVQTLVGHSNFSTTLGYYHVNEEDMVSTINIALKEIR